MGSFDIENFDFPEPDAWQVAWDEARQTEEEPIEAEWENWRDVDSPVIGEPEDLPTNHPDYKDR